MGYILLNKSSTKARAGLRRVRRSNPCTWRQPALASVLNLDVESSCFTRLGGEDAFATRLRRVSAWAIYSTKGATVHVPSVPGVVVVSGNIADKIVVVCWRQSSTFYHLAVLIQRDIDVEICLWGSAGNEYWPCELFTCTMTFEDQGWHCGNY